VDASYADAYSVRLITEVKNRHVCFDMESETLQNKKKTDCYCVSGNKGITSKYVKYARHFVIEIFIMTTQMGETI